LTIASVLAASLATGVAAQSGGSLPTAPTHAFAYNPARTSLVEVQAELVGSVTSPAGTLEERSLAPLVSQLGLSATGGSNRLQWAVGVCPEQQYNDTNGVWTVSSHLRTHAFKAGYANIKGTPRAITFAVLDNGGVDYLTITTSTQGGSGGGGFEQTLKGSAIDSYTASCSLQMPFVLRQESHVSTSDVHLDTSAVAIGLTDWKNHVRPCTVIVAEDLDDNGRYDPQIDLVRLSSATPEILMGPGAGSIQGGAYSVDMSAVGANLPAGKYVAKIDYARSSRAENADRELLATADYKGSLTSHGAFFGALVVGAPVTLEAGGALE
jgi:hypothetical protein